MKNETADEFKVGDKVYCAIFGEGEVVAIWTEYKYYPIHVEFSSDTQDYTNDGRIYTYANRTLFFSEPKIEASVTRPFVSKLIGKRVVLDPTYGYCVVIGIVEIEDEDYVTIEGVHYAKNGLKAIYEINSDNLL